MPEEKVKYSPEIVQEQNRNTTAENFEFAFLDMRPFKRFDVKDVQPNIRLGYSILEQLKARLAQDEMPVLLLTACKKTSHKQGDEDVQPTKQNWGGLKCGFLNKKHNLVFRSGLIEINGVKVTGSFYRLLCAVGSKALRPCMDGNPVMPVTAKMIAEELGITEPSVRQCVTRFRRFIAVEYKRMRLGLMGTQDIIRNSRDSKGYELNHGKVCIVFE